MKIILILITISLSLYTASAQNKASISALGARLDTLNLLTQQDDFGITVFFNIIGVESASTVSIGVGALSLTADGISTIFNVVKDGREYYLVQQNMRYRVEGGTVTVFVHLDGKKEDYQKKYLIINITDKDGHSSESQSVMLH